VAADEDSSIVGLTAETPWTPACRYKGTSRQVHAGRLDQAMKSAGGGVPVHPPGHESSAGVGHRCGRQWRD
jgi:hypothetical protein